MRLIVIRERIESGAYDDSWGYTISRVVSLEGRASFQVDLWPITGGPAEQPGEKIQAIRKGYFTLRGARSGVRKLIEARERLIKELEEKARWTRKR
jgi:hypothetical protein